MEQITLNIRARILALLDESSLSENKFAKESKGMVKQSTLNNLLNNTGNPNLSTIVKVCQGFKIQINEFFDTEEFDALKPKPEK
ncbi:MAG: helix-turn-helix domain-containing protein [Clostridiales bacterium]|jgi:transcriptional regulator with XRE-family HTH domain|nr:helix-turn-helix domain-containing protein [Clostridiales bacterium]